MIKRIFDVSMALTGLALLFPLLIAVACLIKLDSLGPVIFRQERIGQRFQPFIIYKFRTMIADTSSQETQGLRSQKHRITHIGKWLRKTKIDELPQLLNVFKGDMSLVGPRPEIRLYVERFRSDYEEVLTVQPGMTDLASLKYRDEERVLELSVDPEEEYMHKILPEKIRLAKEYMKHSSFLFDLRLIFRTLLCLRY